MTDQTLHLPERNDALHFVAAKASVPKSADWQIERPRLIGQLAFVRDKPLTVIKAGPGFGKTSIAVAWAEQLKRSDAQVAWLRLDAEDDEPTRFLFYLVQALNRANALAGEASGGLIAALPLASAATLAAALIKDLANIQDDLFLFIDDFHFIKSTTIRDTLSKVLKYAPDSFHLILICRSKPALHLETLRSQNRLFEIDTAAMRFDTEEIKTFLGAEGVGELTDSQLVELRQKTEGWPAVLRILVATSTPPSDGFSRRLKRLSGAARPISAYFAELLEDLPPGLTDFMLGTAVLERLNAQLCETVTESRLSEGWLEALEDRHLLLSPLDADGRWRRYHPLLADHLLRTLQNRHPDRISGLHGRAARWFATNAFWTEAIKHAIAAGEMEAAAGWVENAAMPLVKRGDLLTLLEWRRLFPKALMRGQVEAKLAIAWGLALAYRLDEALRLLIEIEGELQFSPAERIEPIRAQCDTVRAVIAVLEGDTLKGLALAEDCLPRAPDRWTANVASNVIRACHWKNGDLAAFYAVFWAPLCQEEQRNALYSTVHRSMLYTAVEAQQLRIGLAERHCQEAFKQAQEWAGPQSLLAAIPASVLAHIRYYQGRFEDAETLLAGRFPMINAAAMLDGALYAYIVQARICAHRGHLEDAYRCLENGEQLAHARGTPTVLAPLLAERVRLYRLEGRLPEMEACIARLDRYAQDYPAPRRCAWSVIHTSLAAARADLALAKNLPTKALLILETLRHEEENAGNLFLAQSFAVKAALALLAMNRRAEAIAAFRRVALKAVELGLPQIILDAGPEVGILLRQMQEDIRPSNQDAVLAPAINALVDRWSKMFGGGRLALSPAAADPLSPRECSILELIGKGLSNKEIGRELGVTAETVKSHIKHIFIKLGVNRRAQAVAQAQRLGLIRFR